MKLSVVAGLAALTIAAPAIPQASFPNPFFFASEAIPQIRCFGAAGSWTGSGVRISDDIILSARHVTNGEALCTAEDSPLKMVNAEADFAANRAELGNGLRLIVSCAGIREGGDYFAAGYGLGGKLMMERLVGTDERSGRHVRMKGRVYGGMSGGPVLDGEGRVVAIVNQRLIEVSFAHVHPLSETYLCR